MMDPTSMAEIPTGTLIRENSISGGNSTGAVRRPTIRLITPITEDSQKTTPETPSPAPLDSSPSPSLNREKSFKRERRNSFIPVFFVCKVYVKANGQQSPRHQLEPLVVERDWTFDDFLTFASRKIDMTNASRAFSRLGVEITSIFMLEDETDVYLSTGCDFIEPLEHTHVTEHNVTPTTPLSMKDIHSGQTGGGIRIESTGPAPASGRPNVISLTGESQSQVQSQSQSQKQAQTQTQGGDAPPCRSIQVNFSGSTKDSTLDEVVQSKDLTGPVNSSAINGAADNVPAPQFGTTESEPVNNNTNTNNTSRDHSTDGSRSSSSSSLVTTKDSEASRSPFPSPTSTTRLPDVTPTSASSPATGRAGSKKGHVKHDRGSFSGSLDLDRLKVYVKANGEFSVQFEVENPGKGLVVERNWSFKEFLTVAGRKIGMPNASRVFTRLGVEITDTFMLEDESDVYLSTFADFFVPLQESSEDELTNTGSIQHALRCEELGIPTTVAMYSVCEQLGDGGFGIVMLGVHKLDPTVKVALKFLSKEIYDDVETAALLNMEIQCLSMLNHKNILRLHDRLETASHVVLSVDLMCGGDLLKYCSSRGTTAAACALPEDEVRHIFKQVLDGVTYMHHQRIVHRDLKLENILMCGTASRVVKISDFGISMHLISTSTRVTTRYGTSAYMPPELLNQDGPCSCAGPPLDYWALGNILFALICGRLPFLGVPALSTPVSQWPLMSTVEANIRSCQYEFEPHVVVAPGGDGIHDVIRILLQEDPSERTLLNHAWVRRNALTCLIDTDTDTNVNHRGDTTNDIDQSSHRTIDQSSHRTELNTSSKLLNRSEKESIGGARRDSGNKVDMARFPFLGVLPGVPTSSSPRSSAKKSPAESPRLCLGQGNATALLTHANHVLGQAQGLGQGLGIGQGIGNKGMQSHRKGSLGLVDNLSRSGKDSSLDQDPAGFDAMVNNLNALRMTGNFRSSGKLNVSGKASSGGSGTMGTWTMGDPAGLVPSSISNRCEKVDEEGVDLDNRPLGYDSEHSMTSFSSIPRRKSPALGSNTPIGSDTPLGNRTPPEGGKLEPINSKKIEDLLSKLDNADRLVQNMKLLDRSYGRRNSVILNDSNHSTGGTPRVGGGSFSQKTPRRANSVFFNKDSNTSTKESPLSVSTKNPSPTRFRVAGGGSIIDLSPISSPQQQQAKLYCKLR